MTLDKIIVAVIGIVGIVFTYWFFLMKKETIVESTSDSVDITVDGGYTPEVISIPQGKLTKLNFFRKDPSGCLEEVVLPDFKVKKFLPVNKTTTIEITPKEKGTFVYSCGMNMFHGKIIVI